MRYDINPRLGFRLDYHRFTSTTRSFRMWGNGESGEELSAELEVIVNPIIFSAIYEFYPFFPIYVGVGVGMFPSEMKLKYSSEPYHPLLEGSWYDGSMGFQLFGEGKTNILENLIVAGEIRYISAEVIFGGMGNGIQLPRPTTCDWSGLMGNVFIEYNFS